jgi:hypothetical protein
LQQFWIKYFGLLMKLYDFLATSKMLTKHQEFVIKHQKLTVCEIQFEKLFA